MDQNLETNSQPNNPNIIPNNSFSVPPRAKNRRLLVLVIILILIIIASVWFFYRDPAGLFKKSTSNISTSPPGQLLSGKSTLQQLSATSTPKGFPKDFPIIASSTMIASYNHYSSSYTSIVGAEKVFSVPTSADTVYQFYKNYLQMNDWSVTHTGQSNFTVKGLSQGLNIIAQKSGNTVSIGIFWDKKRFPERLFILFITQKK